ncbi:MAG: DUF3857 domain-containing protein [Planctomycetota bacterium]
MESRSIRGGVGLASFLLTALFLGSPAMAQDLPAEVAASERSALAARAAGDRVGAALQLIDAAEQLAGPIPSDPAARQVAAARIETWVTVAARTVPTSARLDLLGRLDALADSNLATELPLLRDRIRIAGLEAADDVQAALADLRAAELGFVPAWWVIGPFDNERGSGYATELPPERGIDLDAERTGKNGPVRWHALPKLPGQPILPLERLLHPHEQTLAFVAVAVMADAPTQAVLEVGSTGAVKAFVAGSAVLARDVERPFGFDQDAAPLQLAAGANLLLVKVCHQEGNRFRFAARLRGLDGARLNGVRYSVERADLDAAIAAVGGDGAGAIQAELDLGGRTTWTIGEQQGMDALRLAWLWYARQADGDRDRRDLVAARAAVEQLPDVAEAHLAVAACLERHGRSAADRDDNDRRRAFESALACTEHVEAIVELGRLLLDGSNLKRDALACADRALRLAPTHTGALWLRYSALRAIDLDDLASAELIGKAGRLSLEPEMLRVAADLIARTRPARALAWVREAAAATGAEYQIAQLGRLLARTGAREEALQLLGGLVDADPFANEARQALVELLLAGGDAAAALGRLDRWLELAPGDAAALVKAAACWRRLQGEVDGAAEQQLGALREALAREPNRRDEERYAEFLASAVDGAEDEANAFYSAFVVDAVDTVEKDPGAPAEAIAAKDPVRWILRQRVVRANANGTSNLYLHDIVRILTEDGARQLAYYRVPYYRGEQRGRLLGCTLFRAGGGVEFPTLRGDRVAMPDLRPGDVVAIEGRVDDLRPTFFGDYFGYVHQFASSDGSPVQQSELVVLAAPGRDYRWQVTNGAPEPERTTHDDGTLQLRFAMRDLPRDEPEIRRPDRKEFDPEVRITTYRDWQHFAGWWWNLIKNQLEVTQPMRDKVAELCAGAGSIEQKIARIYEFVVTDVRYEAWEFGVHGYKPYSTSVIFERRHGDCKDKALLLCALLGEIGVQAKPVLIFADPMRSKDDLTLAMVQQFNHCIAWLPAQDGRPAQFLDGTATWHPTDTLPEMDQGADVLVVDAGKALLLEVPWTTPVANLEQTELLVELQQDGSASFVIEDRPRGNAAVGLRSMLATEPARRREAVEGELVRKYGKMAVTSIEASDDAGLEDPVHRKVRATASDLGTRGSGRWQLPSTWERFELEWLSGDQPRHQAVLLGPPHGQHQRLRLRPPAGWRPGDLPEAVVRETRFARFSMTWSRDGDDVVVERALEFLLPRVEVADYPALREFVTAVRGADAQLLLLQQEGGR